MADIEERKDVVYGDAGNRPLKLDIYKPTQRNGAAVLVVHGGGWSRGSKDMLANCCRLLAEQGFVALASEYRLTGEAPFPANIHDVKRAIRWAKANAADLGFDPAKLCLEGHSAGAHLVLLAAGTPGDTQLDPPEGMDGVSGEVAAVTAIYPPTIFHFDGARPSGALAARVLPGADLTAETAAIASPMTHVTAAFPPTMLLHGDADKVVPVSASRRFEEKLREVGGKVDLHIYAGLPHGFANHPDIQPNMMGMIGAFFRRWAIKPEVFAQAAPAAAREPVPAGP
ncbi:MAG TPA: alpha/beta hydrolase [Caulobacteraceae bacterium]|jgi:acetyl esterase/lipase